MLAARTAEAPPELRNDDVSRFSFPCKTVSEANTRCSPMARARRVKMQRETATWNMRAMNQARRWLDDDRVVVLLRRLAPSNGLDDDNLRSALKAIRDGLADGLGVDDGDPSVTWEYDQRRGPYGVEVEIRRR